MRISVIGLTGSGKSTLTRYCGEHYGIPSLYLDTVQFLPGWRSRPIDEQRAMVSRFLDDHESWVIDGNYTNLSYRRRLNDSDLIVVMLFNRWVRLRRVLMRLRTYHGRSRPSMTSGCEERMDAAFVWWILHQGCDAAHMQEYRDVMRDYGGSVVVVRNQRELDRLMATLPDDPCSC
ncbi:DNA topology modulation protein FlaR [Bifidobacterium ramosum]|nr:DNA topology modulation protein FlaR [Bifidobacterium ramosum]NEG72863.1 DNA topology modulation protein FlaR [Bifidobacterium ramosum]